MDIQKHQAKCEELLQKCKHEAKQLLEANATKRKVHWTHPSFTAFCLSVEDVLCYGVRRRYQVATEPSLRRPLTSSGKILQAMSKDFPVALSMYSKCYEVMKSSDGIVKPKPEYARPQNNSMIELRIVWLRTAIIEKTLKLIVEEILKKPSAYYTSLSVFCHSVYGELFCFLLDGPCAISYSRVRTLDVSSISPAPSEIVSRHSQYVVGQEQPRGLFPSGEAWEHVQSLYQSPLTKCLYGKNNVMMQPPSFDGAIPGYLTLVAVGESIILKWIPNILLRGSKRHTDSLMWGNVLSEDVCNSIAHLHCHQSDSETELIMVAYNGIALPALYFPESSSMLHFLEALENALHPRGCLEPPLWFLKNQHTQALSRARSTSLSDTLMSLAKHGSPSPPIAELEKEFPLVWNQVFRVRFSHRPGSTGSSREGSPLPNEGPHLAHNSHSSPSSLSSSFAFDHSSSGSLPPPLQPVPVETPPPLVTSSPIHMSSTYNPGVGSTSSQAQSAASSTSSGRRRLSKKPSFSSRNELEKVQSNVSRQLLARYFYSWLSYCRHISNVKSKVSHLINQELPLIAVDPQEGRRGNKERDGDGDGKGLGSRLWNKFLEERSDLLWNRVLKTVYEEGVQKELRAQVWPYLLRLFDKNCSAADRDRIIDHEIQEYQGTLRLWKELERENYVNKDPTSTSLEIRQGHFEGVGITLSKKESAIADSKRLANGYAGGEGLIIGSGGLHIANNQPAFDSGVNVASLKSQVPVSLPAVGQGENNKWVTNSSPMLLIQVDDGDSVSPKPSSTQDAVPTEFEWAINSISPSPVLNGVGSDDSQLSECSDLTSEDTLSLNEMTPTQPVVDSGRNSAEPFVEASVSVIDSQCNQKSPLTRRQELFLQELFKIDKDIPRCDRDYEYFQASRNLAKLRNLIASYVWHHLDLGYSQGMCDLLAPLLVVFDNEAVTYGCFKLLMEFMEQYFPPKNGMAQRMANLRALLQVLESDFYQYLLERPMGDGIFYSYRWFLVNFKREFTYENIFELWEISWASRIFVSQHFEEFVAFAILSQYKLPIMDAQLDPSEILNLFTDLADKTALNCQKTIEIARQTIDKLRGELEKRE